MYAVLAVCKIILRVLQILLWILLLPFIILVYITRMMISRLRFKSKLRKSGMNKEWAKKLTKQYSLSIKDISYMIKFVKRQRTDEIV